MDMELNSPVQMHWMWDWHHCTLSLLDDPVRPDVLNRELDKIIRMRIRGVLINDVLQRRLVPIDVNGSQIDTPKDNILTITGNLLAMQIDLEIVGLINEVVARNICCPPWNERRFVLADCRCWCALSCGVCNRDTIVREDAAATELVGAGTITSRLCPEPVI